MSGWAVGVSAELGAGVVSRLAALEAASRGLREPVELARLRAELLAVVEMWRGLLAGHAPSGQSGRCPRCRGWWGRRRWPCQVWTAAHTVLVALEYPARPALPVDGAPAPRRLGLAGPAPPPRPGLTIVPRQARVGRHASTRVATSGGPW